MSGGAVGALREAGQAVEGINSWCKVSTRTDPLAGAAANALARRQAPALLAQAHTFVGAARAEAYERSTASSRPKAATVRMLETASPAMAPARPYARLALACAAGEWRSEWQGLGSLESCWRNLARGGAICSCMQN